LAAKLKALDAYVAYGYITYKSVEELVHRRSYIVVSGNRQPLSDNITVENALGEKGILCLSDLSHEIYNMGPSFDESVKFLCTYKLSAPVGKYEKNVLKVHDEVENMGGFIGEDMDAFLNKIL
jgi:large subunit ribosomal protein L7e